MIRIENQKSQTKFCEIDQLRQKYPWPAQRPSAQPIDWCLDAGGKKLVIDLIKELPAGSIVLEIGSFIGGSAIQWLQCSDKFTLICLDPWESGASIRALALKQGQSESTIEQLDGPDGRYQTFLANLWEYRDRVIPVRGYSPAALQEIAAAGIVPDLIYLDADKTGREIEPCHELFPDARITGDDWWFGTDHWWKADEGYPIRRPVREFCRRHNRYLRTEKMTWVIDNDPPPISYRVKRPLYHFKSVRRRLRGLFRAAIGRT